MALFTGRSGDANLSRQRYAAGLAHKDAMNLRRATNAIAEEDAPVRGVGPTQSMGNIADTRRIGPDPDAWVDQTPQADLDKLNKGPQVAAGLALPGGENNVTKAGSRVAQSNNPQDSAATQMAKDVVGTTEFNTRLHNIRMEQSLGMNGDPATNPIARVWGFFTDDEAGRASREQAGVVTDWYDSDEALAYFRKFPKELDMARKDPRAFYDRVVGKGMAAPVVQAANQAATVPGANRGKLLPLAQNAVDNMDRIMVGDNPEREMILDLAAEVGVDEATALTVWGIETNFGSALDNDPTAKGSLQVTDETFDSMKRWFGDFRNYGRNRLDPGLMEYAQKMERGDPTSEYIAGLMRMKYNEIIGVPQKDWGAAYQANAEKVRANGGPLDIDDGITTNSDYNTAFNQLRAEIELTMSGAARPAPDPAATPAPQQVAGVQTPPTNPADPAKQPNPKQAKKEVQEQAGVAEVPAGPVKDALTKTNPKAPKVMVNMQLLNKELQLSIAKRKQLFMMADAYKRAGMGAQYIAALGTLNAMTATTTNLAQQKAVNLFENSGDPRMLQQMWSQQMGRPITIVPRSDGKWDVMSGGQMVNEGVTTGQITSPARSAMSSEYTTSINQAAAERVGKFQEAQWSAQESALKEQIKNYGSLAVAKLKQAGKITVDAEGGIWIVRGNQLKHYQTGEVRGPDDEMVPGINQMGTSLPGGNTSMSSIMSAAKGVY